MQLDNGKVPCTFLKTLLNFFWRVSRGKQNRFFYYFHVFALSIRFENQKPFGKLAGLSLMEFDTEEHVHESDSDTCHLEWLFESSKKDGTLNLAKYSLVLPSGILLI